MKVSVIIPIYNVENYIADCINSVLNQTLADLEIICVHDAGSDGSWDIVKDFAKKDNRITTIENPENVGLAATRNNGFKHAKGEYVYFLDSDDMIRFDALENLYERAIKENLEVQVFGASFIYENDELEQKFKTNPRVFKDMYPEVLSGRELFIKWMKAWDWMPSQPRFFYKRQFLMDNAICYPEGMLHEDEIFTFEVLEKAKSVRVTNDEFFIRRFRAASIMTGGPTIKNVEGCINILDRAASSVVPGAIDDEWNSAVKYYMFKIFKDVTRKYKLASVGNKSDIPMINMLSEDIKNDERKMAIYHMVEASGIWEDA